MQHAARGATVGSIAFPPRDAQSRGRAPSHRSLGEQPLPERRAERMHRPLERRRVIRWREGELARQDLMREGVVPNECCQSSAIKRNQGGKVSSLIEDLG